MKRLSFMKKKPSKKSHCNTETRYLQTELVKAREDLRQAYLRFDQVVDGDLIEACIYQMNAAMAQCNYLVRMLKSQNGDPTLQHVQPHTVAAANMEDQSTWT